MGQMPSDLPELSFNFWKFCLPPVIQSSKANFHLSTYQMESSEDIELINLAIQKLIEEKRIKDTSGYKFSEDDDDQLLSRLLSQLESLKGDITLKQSELEVTSRRVDKAEAKSENGSQVDSGCGEIGVEEIVKELKAIKKQNTITHCLLSLIIVVTVTWQLSEVSLFLKVKNGLTHPFRSFGRVLVGMLSSPVINTHEAEKHNLNHLVDPSLPFVNITDLPHLGSSSEH
ncbi:uncharacterized protein LOC111318007 [Durio zibethinus]|uniref:Uncharacterized protein LOC111318007 n=1 Tax=Durio zibethinus TaxID=66656 RepID=A0A6P6BGY3_DURZI|nr:uncharacterized protein LOC111318007 [Durio zibethinus]